MFTSAGQPERKERGKKSEEIDRVQVSALQLYSFWITVFKTSGTNDTQSKKKKNGLR